MPALLLLLLLLLVGLVDLLRLLELQEGQAVWLGRRTDGCTHKFSQHSVLQSGQRGRQLQGSFC